MYSITCLDLIIFPQVRLDNQILQELLSEVKFAQKQFHVASQKFINFSLPLALCQGCMAKEITLFPFE